MTISKLEAANLLESIKLRIAGDPRVLQIDEFSYKFIPDKHSFLMSWLNDECTLDITSITENDDHPIKRYRAITITFSNLKDSTYFKLRWVG